MKLYFASLYSDRKEVWEHEPPKHLLLSYHYGTQTRNTMEYCKARGLCENISLILDSGAFSCWNKGITINIGYYRDFILRTRDTYKFKELYPVNLDVIPGKQGDIITREMAMTSAKQGMDNYMWFKKQGIETIHVYHQGEDEQWLLDVIIKECKYIGVSPSNDASTSQKHMWCERIFNLLPADIKSHGFAVTSESLMRKYPWYSVDSASWCRKSGFGNILTTKGELIFSTKGRLSFLSGRHPESRKVMMEKLRKEFAENGIIVEDEDLEHRLKYDLKLRNLINYKHLLRVERELNAIAGKDDKYVSKQKELF